MKPDTSELVGRRINKLRVLSRVEDIVRPNGKKRPVFLCECDCGNKVDVESQTLRAGNKIDCGCGTSERLSLSHKGLKESTKTQWDSYSSYAHMMGRCYDPKEKGYDEYGGRGIVVCDLWRKSFWNFAKDMGERPKGHVIDRIDPNDNYSPSNCRWVERGLSSFNTRKAVNNTSGRTGVYWFDRVGKWTAAIVFEKRQIHLGYFNTFEAAASARERAEMLYYGELKIG